MTPLDDRVVRTVISLVAKHLGCDAASVRVDERLIDDLGGDSLGLVQLQLALEEAFDIDIDEATIPSLVTVRDIVVFLGSSKTD